MSPMRRASGQLISITEALSMEVNKPVKSETHGQYNAWPTVTFPVAGHRCPVIGTKLYCLVTEAHVCEQLAQCCYLAAEWPGVKPTSQHHNHHTIPGGKVANYRFRCLER